MSGSNLKSWPKGKAAKTCPMSRHAAMIANDLRSKAKGGYGKLLRDAGYEVDHMAATLEATVVSLWQAREFMEWEPSPPTKRHQYGSGKWVPIAKGFDHD
jgi:hypothetical protein